MLSEEEIKDLITCALWDADERGSRNGIDNAARAIAERLREGVVELGSGRIGIFYDVKDKPYNLVELDSLSELKDGERLASVIVRREGDGQGVD